VDIYAFGVLMWHVLSREIPFKYLNFMTDIERSLEIGRRPEIPEWFPVPVQKIIAKTWVRFFLPCPYLPLLPPYLSSPLLPLLPPLLSLLFLSPSSPSSFLSLRSLPLLPSSHGQQSQNPQQRLPWSKIIPGLQKILQHASSLDQEISRVKKLIEEKEMAEKLRIGSEGEERSEKSERSEGGRSEGGGSEEGGGMEGMEEFEAFLYPRDVRYVISSEGGGRERG
jgi:hypothetical protein